MATGKSKSSAKRSSAKRSTAKKTTAAKQTSRAAGDNEPGANLVNEKASQEAQTRAVEAQQAAAEAATAELPEAVAKQILQPDPDEPITSLNNLRKDEGGLPADVLAGIRSSVDSARGSAALGQPGQEGHGVGTGTVGLTAIMSEEEAAADHAEYQRRFGGKS